MVCGSSRAPLIFFCRCPSNFTLDSEPPNKMTDLFQDKSVDWDAQAIPARISQGVGAALLKNVRLSKDMLVMDFGAGTGLVAAHLAPHVKKIFAVDISQSMLDKLGEKEELRGKVVTVCQNILARPFEQTVDLVVSAMALHHVEDTDLLLTRFADQLEKGGRIALADLSQEDGTFHPAEVEGVYHHGFDVSDLTTRLESNGFANVEFFEALTIEKEEKRFPVFLVTATKS